MIKPYVTALTEQYVTVLHKLYSVDRTIWLVIECNRNVITYNRVMERGGREGGEGEGRGERGGGGVGNH